MERGGCIYILTNQRRTVLYTGVTSDLVKRIWQHKNKKYPKGFTSRYNVDQLVYYEVIPTIKEAILREKKIKNCSRRKKELLIDGINPSWKDLYEEVQKW